MGLFSWNKTIKELLINTKYEKYIEVLDKRNIRTVDDFMSYRYDRYGHTGITNLKLQLYLKDCIGDDLYGIIDIVDDHRNNLKREGTKKLYIGCFIFILIFLLFWTYICFITYSS